MGWWRHYRARFASALGEFFELEAASGILLIGAGLLGLVAANSPLASVYDQLLHLPLTVKLGEVGVEKPILLWINDGLMAIFFLLVALELKREVLAGRLADSGQRALPAACAVGGMLVPMGIYLLLNHGDPRAVHGFAIPAATDIAFALGVLALAGSRVPPGLKVLLTAIAVLDDLGAIILIALFYSEGLALRGLVIAAIAFAGLLLLNRSGVTSRIPYLLLGIVLWLAVLKSGVHATLAGVVLGLTIPMRGPADDPTPLARLEHDLHPTVAYAIVPLFAFANAGVSLAGLSLSALLDPVPLGIALGLVLGKPIGVLGAAGLMILAGRARLPEGASWSGLAGMAILCGIGFTMSLFIGSLAFEASHADLLVANRIGILAGTTVAALAGFAVLRLLLPAPAAERAAAVPR
jgi:NhaA family Na+:H+ antiporter